MTSMQTALSLSELEGFDLHASSFRLGQEAKQQRFLCPLCGDGKPKDSAHRCLSLNPQNGVWHCHRCGEGGKLREMWDERPPLPRRERARAALAQTFAVPSAPVTSPDCPEPNEAAKAGWKCALRGLQALSETRGSVYLHERGMSVETASAAGTRYSSNFLGRPAVVFPLRDRQGKLVGAQGRYVDGRDQPKARTLGDKRSGLFLTDGALDATMPVLLVTEAPLDALSLAQVGYPAVAVCGTEPPTWFHRLAAFRRVLLAFDADEAGDRAASKIAPLLTSFGARCERLRPEGAKDWNELLQREGRDALADFLAFRVLAGE